jgi:phenylalanyl-tRNA synthetase beta chain
MVYVYAKQSVLNKYIGKSLSVEEITSALVNLGMDIKGQTSDTDPELKIEITAEKIDMVSIVGIARAIKYYLGLATQMPKYSLLPAQHKVLVKSSAVKAYPAKTACAILRNVPMSAEFLEEMIELQEKITTSFGRNRSKAGIGIYPIDSIEFPITFTGEKPGDIVFRPLGHTHELNGNQILEMHEKGKKFAHLLVGNEYFSVFRDSTGKVLAMPPIINSHETAKVDVHHRDLFIEVSGKNLHLLDLILKVLVTTFIEMGAHAEKVKVEYEENDEVYELSLSSWFDEISVEFVNKLIGFTISDAECMELLHKMMYGVEKIENGVAKIEIPCFRGDVWHDVDVADDIARAYGYNNITPRFPNISTVGSNLPFSEFCEQISNTLVGMGFLETYTYILTSSEDQFEKMCLDESKEKYVRLTDTSEEGTNMCRVRILPEVLSALHINRKHKYPQHVFENGFTLQVDETKDTGARNATNLNVTIADPKANYTNIKAILDELMHLLEVQFSVKEVALPYFIEGRSAQVFVGDENIGVIGELHPQVLDNVGLLVPVVSFEIDLDLLWKLRK